MSVIYDESGTNFQLGAKLASGGQGVVWRIQGTDDYLFKQYHKPPTHHESAKHRILRVNGTALANFAAMPISLGFSDITLARHIGIFIPYVGGHQIVELYNARARSKKFPNASWKFLVRVACNLAAAFEELHLNEVIVGDVNEQNIKVLPDATIRFIDCDSFQIKDNLRTYTSDVGTPLWTAPELHGRDLTGLERVKNHDLFGLAQLIFLLLFTGRHPFAGKPRTGQHLDPVEAIRQHAFAFAPKEMNLPLAPPPGSLSFDALPGQIKTGFLKAFSPQSAQANSRPTAKDWGTWLSALYQGLNPCKDVRSHIFWRGASRCPWCQIAGDVGFDFFPFKRGNAQTSNFNATGTIRERIKNLRPHDFQISRPSEVSGLVPTLPLKPTGMGTKVYQFFASKTWEAKWAAKAAASIRAQLHIHSSEITQLQSSQQKIISQYRHDFAMPAARIFEFNQFFSSIEALRAKCLSEVMQEDHDKELDVHLKRIYIGCGIPQIGPARKATLDYNNIKTAADISSKALFACGLPSNAVTELLNWKRNKTQSFRPKLSSQATPAQVSDADQRCQAKVAGVEAQATAVEKNVQEITRQAQEKLASIERKIIQASALKDQCNVNLAALRNI